MLEEGMVWHDTARHGMAWRGMEMGWRNMAHMEWHGVAWRGMAWRWHGPSRSPSLRTQPPHPTPLPRRPPLCMMPREWRYDMPLATSSRHSSTATCGEGREEGVCRNKAGGKPRFPLPHPLTMWGCPSLPASRRSARASASEPRSQYCGRQRGAREGRACRCWAAAACSAAGLHSKYSGIHSNGKPTQTQTLNPNKQAAPLSPPAPSRFHRAPAAAGRRGLSPQLPPPQTAGCARGGAP